MLDADDLKLEIGEKAFKLCYEKQFSRNKQITYALPSKDYLKYGVYLEHIPTGKYVYVSEMTNQIENLLLAKKKLEELIKKENDK